MVVRNLSALIIAVPALLLLGCVGTGRVGQSSPAARAATRGVDSTIETHALTRTLAARPIVAGDLLEMTVFAAPELSRVVRVGNDGVISVPLIGPVQAMGRTPRELEIALQDTLRRTYMHDPKVLVEVKEAGAQPIYVVGEVVQPGAYVPSGPDRLTVLRAVAVAKGLRPSAAQGRLIVLRPQPGADARKISVNVNEIMKGRSPDFALLPNDVVYVPRNTERAVAVGVVEGLMRVVTLRTVF